MLDFTLSGKDYFDALPQPVLLYGTTIEYCNATAQSLLRSQGFAPDAGAAVPEPLPPADRAPCAVTLHLNQRPWQAVLLPLEGRALCQLSPLREEGTPDTEQLRRLANHLRVQLSSTALSLERLQWELSELEQRRSEALVANLNRNFHQLLRLTDHLDLYTRTEEELNLLYPPAGVNLAELCGEVAASIEPAARQMGCRFTLEGEAERCLVRANPNLLCRVLYNLISNALRSGGDLTLRLRQREERVLLTLSDTGSGLDLSLLPTLFDPESREEGFALGLPLCRKLVQLWSGQLMAAPGTGGTTVSLSLPVYRNEQELRDSRPLMDNGYDLLLTELSDVLPGSMYAQDDVF